MNGALEPWADKKKEEEVRNMDVPMGLGELDGT
jgi:hypothetical protein